MSKELAIKISNDFADVRGDKEYNRVLREMCTIAAASAASSVLAYYDIGKRMRAMLLERDGLTISDVARDIKIVSKGRLSYLDGDSLYRALKLFDTFKPEQIQIAMERGIALRQLLPLTAKDITPESRDHLLTKVNAGELEPTKVAEAAREVMPSRELRTEKRGGSSDRSPLKLLRAAPGLVAGLREKLNPYPEFVREICRGGDAAAMLQASEKFREVQEEMEVLASVWTKISDRVKQELGKVAEITG